MLSPFEVKICGVVSPACVEAVAQAKADALGLNFVFQSPRYLDQERSRDVLAVIPNSIARVGVFVNETAENIKTIIRMAKLDYVQLHGDEPLDFLKQMPAGRVIRGLRLRAGEGVEVLADYERACREQGIELAAFLVDAFSAQAYGGTGKRVDWELLRGWRDRLQTPLLLAGGLVPSNVGQAIETVCPSGVDTASGVELNGRKDPELTRGFVRAAKDAFSRLESGD